MQLAITVYNCCVSTFQQWKRINDFAYAMLETVRVLSVLDGLEEPAEFVSALRKLLPNIPGTCADSVAMGTPAEKLASSIFLYRDLSRKRIGEMSYKGVFSDLSRIIN